MPVSTAARGRRSAPLAAATTAAPPRIRRSGSSRAQSAVKRPASRSLSASPQSLRDAEESQDSDSACSTVSEDAGAEAATLSSGGAAEPSTTGAGGLPSASPVSLSSLTPSPISASPLLESAVSLGALSHPPPRRRPESSMDDGAPVMPSGITKDGDAAAASRRSRRSDKSLTNKAAATLSLQPPPPPPLTPRSSSATPSEEGAPELPPPPLAGATPPQLHDKPPTSAPAPQPVPAPKSKGKRASKQAAAPKTKRGAVVASVGDGVADGASAAAPSGGHSGVAKRHKLKVVTAQYRTLNPMSATELTQHQTANAAVLPPGAGSPPATTGIVAEQPLPSLGHGTAATTTITITDSAAPRGGPPPPAAPQRLSPLSHTPRPPTSLADLVPNSSLLVTPTWATTLSPCAATGVEAAGPASAVLVAPPQPPPPPEVAMVTPSSGPPNVVPPPPSGSATSVKRGRGRPRGSRASRNEVQAGADDLALPMQIDAPSATTDSSLQALHAPVVSMPRKKADSRRPSASPLESTEPRAPAAATAPPLPPLPPAGVTSSDASFSPPVAPSGGAGGDGGGSKKSAGKAAKTGRRASGSSQPSASGSPSPLSPVASPGLPSPRVASASSSTSSSPSSNGMWAGVCVPTGELSVAPSRLSPSSSSSTAPRAPSTDSPAHGPVQVLSAGVGVPAAQSQSASVRRPPPPPPPASTQPAPLAPTHSAAFSASPRASPFGVATVRSPLSPSPLPLSSAPAPVAPMARSSAGAGASPTAMHRPHSLVSEMTGSPTASRPPGMLDLVPLRKSPNTASPVAALHATSSSASSTSSMPLHSSAVHHASLAAAAAAAAAPTSSPMVPVPVAGCQSGHHLSVNGPQMPTRLGVGVVHGDTGHVALPSIFEAFHLPHQSMQSHAPPGGGLPSFSSLTGSTGTAHSFGSPAASPGGMSPSAIARSRVGSAPQSTTSHSRPPPPPPPVASASGFAPPSVQMQSMSGLAPVQHRPTVIPHETSFQSFGPGSGGPPTSHIYPQPLDPEDDDEPAAADHSPATVPIAPGFPAVVVVDEEEPSVLEPESRGELDAPLFDTRTAGSVASAMFSESTMVPASPMPPPVEVPDEPSALGDEPMPTCVSASPDTALCGVSSGGDVEDDPAPADLSGATVVSMELDPTVHGSAGHPGAASFADSAPGRQAPTAHQLESSAMAVDAPLAMTAASSDALAAPDDVPMGVGSEAAAVETVVIVDLPPLDGVSLALTAGRDEPPPPSSSHESLRARERRRIVGGVQLLTDLELQQSLASRRGSSATAAAPPSSISELLTQVEAELDGMPTAGASSSRRTARRPARSRASHHHDDSSQASSRDGSAARGGEGGGGSGSRWRARSQPTRAGEGFSGRSPALLPQSPASLAPTPPPVSDLDEDETLSLGPPRAPPSANAEASDDSSLSPLLSSSPERSPVGPRPGRAARPKKRPMLKIGEDMRIKHSASSSPEDELAPTTKKTKVLQKHLPSPLRPSPKKSSSKKKPLAKSRRARAKDDGDAVDSTESEATESDTMSMSSTSRAPPKPRPSSSQARVRRRPLGALSQKHTPGFVSVMSTPPSSGLIAGSLPDATAASGNTGTTSPTGGSRRTVRKAPTYYTKLRRHLVFIMASDGFWSYIYDDNSRYRFVLQEEHSWVGERLYELHQAAHWDCRQREEMGQPVRPYWEVFAERCVQFFADREAYAPNRGRYDDFSMFVGVIDLDPIP